MYTAHFGLNSKPFKPSDPEHYYRNFNFDTASADILDGLREKRGLILLTGEAGIGKTLVARRCVAEASDIRFIQLTYATLTFPDILNYLCADLALAVEGLTAGEQESLLLKTLADRARQHQITALLIDDAHHLPDDALLALHRFVETPPLPNQRLQVLLIGLPELADKLARPEFSPLRDSIRVHCRLEPLSEVETGLFIDHQLTMAGWAGDRLLSPAAIERINFYCHGVPRTIAMLCDVMLWLASLQSEREIVPSLVDEAAQNCFLSEQPRTSREEALAEQKAALLKGLVLEDEPLAVAMSSPESGFDLAEFDALFDFDERTVQTIALTNEANVVAHEALVISERPLTPEAMPHPAAEPNNVLTAQGDKLELSLEPISGSNSVPPVKHDGPKSSAEWVLEPNSVAVVKHQELESPLELNQLLDLAFQDESLSPLPASPIPTTPPAGSALEEFNRLLEELTGKLARNHPERQAAIHYFLERYQRLAQGSDPGRTAALVERLNRLAEVRQPLYVGLATTPLANSGQDQVLWVLLLNPSWWLYREIRLRVRSTDLAFAADGRLPPLRLLDGRDAEVLYLNYQSPFADSTDEGLQIELDLCDHRGEWNAFNSRIPIALEQIELLPKEGYHQDSGNLAQERFWPGTSKEGIERLYTLPIELENDPARTRRLREVTARGLGRGTLLTRALLLAADPLQAPARIEVVSRPFMIFGRQSSTGSAGFGDFTLGFVPKYNRISRLHCLVCALGNQLSLMPVSDAGHTYISRNGQRLVRGHWEVLANDDILEICELYQLKLAVAWDSKWEPAVAGWDPQQPREKFGRYLLDVVEVLHQRDRQSESEALRDTLRQRYRNLLRVQERTTRLNGVGNPGSLLYARFERQEPASREVIHFYVPKWLSLGSAPEVGLRIEAEGVHPHHAELLFRDGMYWIQNLAEPGTVRVGHHDLATNETLPLESGDALMVGTAWFTFEAY